MSLNSNFYIIYRPDTVGKILKWIYNDAIEEVDVDSDLLAAADRFELRRLHAVCQLALCELVVI